MDIPADAQIIAEIDGVPTQWRTSTHLYVLASDGLPLSRPLTPDELEAVADEHAEQVERAAKPLTLEERVAALEAIVYGTTSGDGLLPEGDSREWDGTAVRPNGRIIWGGETWRNTSGATLVSDPGVYPQGWSQETGLPTNPIPWTPGEKVWAQGDEGNPDPSRTASLREDAGIIYRCIQTHTTQADWRPASTPALWTPQGA